MAGNYIRTKEHREMMSKKFKGRNCYWLKGKKRPPRSKEWCKKISLAQKNNKKCLKNLGIWATKDRPYLAVDNNGKKNPNWKGGKRAARERQKQDIKFILNSRMKAEISGNLKRRGSHKQGREWEKLVGYNSKELKKRLKKTMPEGYTWQDFLSGELHIDHIIPVKVFNFTRPEHTDFKRCWALSNLRLLPAKENLTKGARLNRPFQPALKI